jgi:hypothetical protein
MRDNLLEWMSRLPEDPTECTADELLELISAEELVELVEWLHIEGRALCPYKGHRARRVSSERDLAMFRLRLIDGLTLKQIGERYGVAQEIARKAMRQFGLTGWRRW